MRSFWTVTLGFALGFVLPLISPAALALQITQLSEDLYLHQSEKEIDGWGKMSANGLILVAGKEAFVVDTPWTDEDARAMLEWAKQKGLTLKGVLATHWHEDRAGSFPVFEAAGVATISSAQTQALLKANGKTPASQTFDGDGADFFAGRLQAFYPGAGHAMDNLVVYVPALQVLFGGCLIRAADARGMGFTGDGNLSAWPESVANVMARYPEVKRVVPGHGEVGSEALLSHTHGLAEAANKAKKQ